MSQWKRIRGVWVHTGKPIRFAAVPPPPPGLGISERELMLGPRKKRK